MYKNLRITLKAHRQLKQLSLDHEMSMILLVDMLIATYQKRQREIKLNAKGK